MHKLKELKIWNKAIDVCLAVYKATGTFPKEEIYGLTSQLRRAAVSVPSNIAEGAGRNTDGEFAQFLGIATGSAYELQTQVVIFEKLNLMTGQHAEKVLHDIDELLKMTYSFKQKIKSKTNKS